MARNICFRPTKEFLTDFENYRQIKHIDSDSKAMREICKEWQKQKQDLATLRSLIKEANIETQEKPMPPGSCLRDLKFGTPEQQQIGCKMCKAKWPEYYNECQKMKRGQQ